MRRVCILLVCISILICTLTTSASATEPEQIIISQKIEDMGNGYYFIETISIPATQTYGSSKTGTKTSSCIYSGSTLFTISVTGLFKFDGTTVEATAASGKMIAYVEGVTFGDRRAYVSGPSAIATGSATYYGITIPKTVILTCDKDGNLS